MRDGVWTEELRCELTDAEVLDRGREAARTDRELAEIEEQLDKAKQKAKGDAKPLESKLKRLMREVRDQAAYRPVDCIERLGGDVVEVIRTDTGELVRTRPATDHDRQGQLEVMDPLDRESASE